MVQSDDSESKAPLGDTCITDFRKSRNFYGGVEGALGEALEHLVVSCGGDPNCSHAATQNALKNFKGCLEDYTGQPLD